MGDCQAGGWDCIGCIVFTDGTLVVAPCLTMTVKPHPDWSLVTEPSVYIMRSCGLLFSWMRSLISDSVLPVGHFLAGVSHSHTHRDTGIGLGTFPTPWFAWALSANILAVLSLLLDPSKTCPSQSVSFCIFHCFMEWVVEIFNGTQVWFDLLHFLSVCIGGRCNMNHMVSMGVS